AKAKTQAIVLCKHRRRIHGTPRTIGVQPLHGDFHAVATLVHHLGLRVQQGRDRQQDSSRALHLCTSFKPATTRESGAPDGFTTYSAYSFCSPAGAGEFGVTVSITRSREYICCLLRTMSSLIRAVATNVLDSLLGRGVEAGFGLEPPSNE